MKWDYKTSTNEVLSFLKKNPVYSYNAPTIFKHFKGQIPVNTIRSILRRLDERKQIIRESHGFYRVKLDAEQLYNLEHPPTLLHGIMVSMDRVRKLQKRIDTIPAINCHAGGVLDVGDIDRLKTMGFKMRSNFRLVRVFDFDGDVFRRITVTVHSKGRVDIYLNCSNHPVNYHEFRDILSHCDGMLSFLGVFVNRRVVSFGMAKDFRNARMSGCSELSLRAYLNQWFRVYNKERLGVMRVEQHVPRCDVPVGVLVDLFERMFLPVVVDVVGNGRVDEKQDVV